MPAFAGMTKREAVIAALRLPARQALRMNFSPRLNAAIQLPSPPFSSAKKKKLDPRVRGGDGVWRLEGVTPSPAHKSCVRGLRSA
jgi:hypothetical protein